MKEIDKMTRKELAIELRNQKLKNGTLPNVIGRKTPLTEKEFVKRYLNGVGGAPGFKKEELKSLLQREQQRMKIKPKLGGKR